MNKEVKRMKLQLEKNKEFNCNDEEVIQWCVQNLDIKDFNDIPWPGDTECECGQPQIFYQLESSDGKVIANYLNDNCLEVMWVYYCPKCEEWVIDSDH